MTSHVEPVAAFPADLHARRLRLMTWFVRAAGIYNASAVVVLVTPSALDLVGVGEPYSAFWTWLPGLTGLFAGIVLLLSSMNLRLLAAFPYWNAIIRLVFVVATIASFGGDEAFFALLALGDVPLALGTIFGLPWALGRTHRELLTNRLAT
jgi:hypothetical protein